MQNPLLQKTILEIPITDASKSNILEYVIAILESREKKLFITTPNPEMIVYAVRHKEFKTVLEQADIALCDGVGLQVAGTILGKSLTNRFAGVDFVKNICQIISKKPITIGFLGGRRGVAEEASKRLSLQFPGLNVVFSEAGNPDQETVARLQNHESIDLLFVAFGFPKQEQWIYDNLQALPVQVAIGVGGAFDYISGRVPRAPVLLRSFGLEWLFRLIRQPWRIKRQLSLITFIWLVVKERFK